MAAAMRLRFPIVLDLFALLFMIRITFGVHQRAKAHPILVATFGTTKVVPCYKLFEFSVQQSCPVTNRSQFSVLLKSCPFNVHYSCSLLWLVRYCCFCCSSAFWAAA